MARTVPIVSNHSPGDLVTAETWNLGPKALNDWFLNRPMYRGTGNLNQSIPNNSWTAIQFGLDLIDTDGGHTVGGTRYTCQVQGWYWVKGGAAFNPTGVGNVACRIDTAVAKNGSPVVGSSQFLDKGNQLSCAQSASALVGLVPGEYVEIWVRQFTGISENLDPNSFSTESDMNVVWLHQ